MDETTLFGLDIETIATMASVGLTILSTFLGTKFLKYYKLFKQFVEMVEDGKVTKEELEKFVAAVKKHL